MQIIEKQIEELIPYANNPRINDDAVDAVAASIKEFGFKVPIIIDKENVIIAGHTRLRAARKLGRESVPCIMADDLTEQQIKAFRIADNKVAELSVWDFAKLEIELEAISEIDMEAFGFTSEEAEDDIEPVEDDFDEDPEHMTETGQLWQLGRHRLKVGDSTSEENVAELVGGGTDRPVIDRSSLQRGRWKMRKTVTKQEQHRNPKRQHERKGFHRVFDKGNEERIKQHESGRSILYFLCRPASHRVPEDNRKYKRIQTA